jgi:hypothetical protein
MAVSANSRRSAKPLSATRQRAANRIAQPVFFKAQRPWRLYVSSRLPLQAFHESVRPCCRLKKFEHVLVAPPRSTRQADHTKKTARFPDK